MEITDLAYLAICRYFKTLSVFGYKSYKEVNKLILLLFIEELMTSPYAEYITEEDCKVLTESLNCLYGSTCLIDYPIHNIYDRLIHEINYDFVSYPVGNCKIDFLQK